MTEAGNPFPDGSHVTVPYPGPHMTAATPREDWPWYPGVIEQRCDEDEWLVTVYARELATLEDGTTNAPPGTASEDLWYPQCFRNSSELRRAEQAGNLERWLRENWDPDEPPAYLVHDMRQADRRYALEPVLGHDEVFDDLEDPY